MQLHLQPEVDEYWTARNIKIYLSRKGIQNSRVRTLPDLEDYLSRTTDMDASEIFRETSSLAAYQVELITGRVKRNCTYCAAANMEFQGPAADGGLMALWEGYCRGWRMVDFIHDEILQEIPVTWTPEQITAFAEETERVMCGEMQKVTPDVKITAETAVMPRWYKKAEPLYDDKGNLLVWTPELAEMLKKQKQEAA
jgi:hypothetical protein